MGFARVGEGGGEDFMQRRKGMRRGKGGDWEAGVKRLQILWVTPSPRLRRASLTLSPFQVERGPED
jgi:hypothetical protein